MYDANDERFGYTSSRNTFPTDDPVLEKICEAQFFAHAVELIFNGYYHEIKNTLEAPKSLKVTSDTFCAIVDCVQLEQEAEIAMLCGETFVQEELRWYSQDIGELYKIEGASNFTSFFDDAAKTNA